jgi:peptidoglycan/xylan/chitin deacetylase (PgdA/CDA1 family)
MRGRWGPEAKQAAVSLTFDNLGEASDIEFSRWPPDRPVGRHHSVLRDLPAILRALGDARVTFFIEAWNLSVYPAAIQAIAEAAHEIGCHGMRHEVWGLLTSEQELDRIKRCQHDFAQHGIELHGLRPPGGVAAPSSAQVLPAAGLRYISPFSTPSGVLDSGLAILECNPAAADVAFYSPAFTRHRNYKPGSHALSAEDLLQGVMAEVETTIAAGGFVAVLFHPHLQSPTPERTDPARIAAIGEIARRLSADDRLWLATCAQVANWMLDHSEDFPPPPSLSPPEWWDPSIYKTIRRDHHLQPG